MIEADPDEHVRRGRSRLQLRAAVHVRRAQRFLDQQHSRRRELQLAERNSHVCVRRRSDYDNVERVGSDGGRVCEADRFVESTIAFRLDLLAGSPQRLRVEVA